MRGYAVVATYGCQPSRAGVRERRSVDWAMNATIIDGCSCRMLCPCIFGLTAEVGTVGTQKHDGHTSCYFNAPFKVNKGHYGKAKLDGMKFWFAGDKGDAKTVELTFEPSATKEQREGVRVFLAYFLPQKWTSLTEVPDAKIDWKPRRRAPRPSSMTERRLKW